MISVLSRLVHGACHQTLNIGKPLRNMAFDATGSYLQTEIGSVALNALLASHVLVDKLEAQNPQYQDIGLSTDEELDKMEFKETGTVGI